MMNAALSPAPDYHQPASVPRDRRSGFSAPDVTPWGGHIAQRNNVVPLYGVKSSVAGLVAPDDELEVGSELYDCEVISSVVEADGFDRFVYLKNADGAKHVFSNIQPEQIPLYDNAVFAVLESDSKRPLWIGASTFVRHRYFRHRAECEARGGRVQLFVHLLADDGAARDTVIRDFIVSSIGVS
ncbi:MAG: hypothetical protein AAF468_02705 [Pseudomonadota bacterium]